MQKNKKTNPRYHVPEISRHVVDLRGKFSKDNRPQRITIGAVLKATFVGWREGISDFFARFEDGTADWTSNRFGWWRTWRARREERSQERATKKMMQRLEDRQDALVTSGIQISETQSEKVFSEDFVIETEDEEENKYTFWQSIAYKWQRVLFFSSKLTANSRFRSLAVFAFAGLLLLAPLQIVVLVGNIATAESTVQDSSQKALEGLKNGASSFADFDTGSALNAFQQANQNFAQIKKTLQGSTGAIFNLAQLLPSAGKKLHNAKQLLDAGSLLAQIGERLARVGSVQNGDMMQRLGDVDKALGEILPMVQEAQAKIAPLQANDLPSNVREQFLMLQKQLPQVSASAEQLRLAVRAVGQLFGVAGTQRYLVLLQNNDELRPTGGFISGVALMDIEKGKVTRLDVPSGGPYDFKGYFLKQVQSPKPLWLVNPVWQLQDSNYFFDFPTSAKKAIWFFEQNLGGYSVDGVIAITPKMIQDLLQITGPILDEKGAVVVDAQNIVEVMEQSSKPDDLRPKEFLAKLAPQVLQRALDMQQRESFSVVAAVAKSLASRDMQVYMKNEQVEQALHTLGWTGEVRTSPHDYLAIVRTNIAGGKTDLYIYQQVQHTVFVQKDGTLVEKLQIRFDHKGTPEQGEHGIINTSYLRVYVPDGAELIDASGFTLDKMEKKYLTPPEGYVLDEDLQKLEGQVSIDEKSGTRISHEANKTVFGNWIEIQPGQSATVNLEYNVPQNIISTTNSAGVYSLLYQKQSGLQPFAFKSELVLPQGWTIDKVTGAVATPSGEKLDTVVAGDVWYGGIVRN